MIIKRYVSFLEECSVHGTQLEYFPAVVYLTKCCKIVLNPCIWLHHRELLPPAAFEMDWSKLDRNHVWQFCIEFMISLCMFCFYTIARLLLSFSIEVYVFTKLFPLTKSFNNSIECFTFRSLTWCPVTLNSIWFCPPLIVSSCNISPLQQTKTLYKMPPDLEFCLELCQHCACLFHVHVFIQVRGIEEVGYFTCRSHCEYAPHFSKKKELTINQLLASKAPPSAWC